MANRQVDRRAFIRQGTLSVAALTGAALGGVAGVQPGRAREVVTLGRSGLLASRLGLGLGDGKAEAYQKLGQSSVTRLIRHALDDGVRYFDLLPGPAHGLMAEALKGVPRESYTLVTNFRHPEETDPRNMIERYLKELKTDYLDAVLAGAILTGGWSREDRWKEKRDLLSAARQAGRVRAHGVSVHGWEALRSIATDSWVELALVSCNHTGAWMDGPAGKEATELEKRDHSVPLIREARAAGIGIAAMKVFSHSGYRDAKDPAGERAKAIGFVLSLGCIDTMPIMCESLEEFEEVRRLVDQTGGG